MFLDEGLAYLCDKDTENNAASVADWEIALYTAVLGGLGPSSVFADFTFTALTGAGPQAPAFPASVFADGVATSTNATLTFTTSDPPPGEVIAGWLLYDSALGIAIQAIPFPGGIQLDDTMGGIAFTPTLPYGRQCPT